MYVGNQAHETISTHLAFLLNLITYIFWDYTIYSISSIELRIKFSLKNQNVISEGD